MKKKYNKPLINITTVRNEMGFCSSGMVNTKKIETTGHEINEVKEETVNAWNDTEWETTN